MATEIRVLSVTDCRSILSICVPLLVLSGEFKTGMRNDCHYRCEVISGTDHRSLGMSPSAPLMKSSRETPDGVRNTLNSINPTILPIGCREKENALSTPPLMTPPQRVFNESNAGSSGSFCCNNAPNGSEALLGKTVPGS